MLLSRTYRPIAGLWCEIQRLRGMIRSRNLISRHGSRGMLMRVFAGPRVAVPLVADLRASSIGTAAGAHRRLTGPAVIRSVTIRPRVIRSVVLKSVVLKSVVIRPAVLRSAVMRFAVRCAIILLLRLL